MLLLWLLYIPVWKGCPVHAVDFFCEQLDHAKNLGLHAFYYFFPVTNFISSLLLRRFCDEIFVDRVKLN